MGKVRKKIRKIKRFFKNFAKKIWRVIKKTEHQLQHVPDWVQEADADYEGEIDCVGIYQRMKKHLKGPDVYGKVIETYLLRLLQDYSWEWCAGIDSVSDWQDLTDDFIMWLTRGEN